MHLSVSITTIFLFLFFLTEKISRGSPVSTSLLFFSTEHIALRSIVPSCKYLIRGLWLRAYCLKEAKVKSRRVGTVGNESLLTHTDTHTHTTLPGKYLLINNRIPWFHSWRKMRANYSHPDRLHVSNEATRSARIDRYTRAFTFEEGVQSHLL